MASRNALEDLRASLYEAQSRIAAAAARAGRPDGEVTIVAVTKTFPLSTVRLAIEAGLRDLGENRVTELVEKSSQIPGEAMGGTVRWHAIGSLQRNKARDVAERADLFHALDSPRLADALDRRAEEAGRILPVLVQVNISDEGSKSGVQPDEAHHFMAAVTERPHLKLQGVMGMAAPIRLDADVNSIVRPAFASLRHLFETYAGPRREEISIVSMGMSGDYEVAVEEGATHVRIGSALFGARGSG